MCLQHWWNESVIQEVCVCNCRECRAPLQERKSVLLSRMCKQGPLFFTSPSKWLKSQENEPEVFKVLTKLTVILNVGVRLHNKCLRSNYHYFKNLPDKQAINRSPKGPNAPQRNIKQRPRQHIQGSQVGLRSSQSGKKSLFCPTWCFFV